MTVGGILVYAVCPMKDIQAREKQEELLTAASEYGLKNDPNVSKYAVMQRRDGSEPTNVYVFEEYSSPETMKEHFKWPPVQAMIAHAESTNPMTAAPAVVELPVTELCFSKEEVNRIADPWVCVGELEFVPGGIDKAMPYWRDVFKASQDESGTLFYGIYRHPTDPNKMLTVEAYESETYMWDVHAKSDAVVANVANTKHLRVSLKHNILKKVGGYFYNPSSAKL